MPTQSEASQSPLLVIVTGLSGAGLSTAINALQDIGFYCIDNLPVEMVGAAVELIEKGQIRARGFAFGMDIRDRRFAASFQSIKDDLSKKLRLDVVFLTAGKHVLSLRYGATRRKHPLIGADGDLIAAIAKESLLLSPVEKSADAVFDTSSWSPHVLARSIEARYESKDLPTRSLNVTIMSFGFKVGVTRAIDTLFDVRFVANPFFSPDLRRKTGMDQAVVDFVFGDPNAESFYQKIEEMIRYLLPLYHQEGKHYFRIGFGCTGGQHRSVAFAERLTRSLRDRGVPNTIVNIVHRDLELGESAPNA